MEFIHPMKIMKTSPTERGDRIEVVLKASSEAEDSQGEIILKSAYADKNMRNDFQNTGYYDYNHVTDIIEHKMKSMKAAELNALLLEKEKAIIGFPDKSNLAIGMKDEFPTSFKLPSDGIYSYGYLIPSNEYVKEMFPKMKAGFPYGASISGQCAKEDMVGNKITKLKLRKIAIAPVDDVINKDTTVFLKSKNIVLLRNLQKSLTDNYESDYGYGMHDEATEEDRFARLEKKITLLEKVVMGNPELQDQYLDQVMEDIRIKIDSEQLQLGYSPIKDALVKIWCMDEPNADYIANQFLINYRDRM